MKKEQDNKQVKKW